ncbi:uncharacterized protein F4812DRAFT_8042 [Daldinia caldariorum]|uniref:uncharacterized protein n=1 Tax=Daldinia caldariorum TaxID=326644 RepID=UPI0020076915|nr:uncharacterized protein F4812DRAFT_8042 [Daldinia caldariorum]KAI1472308.1 hypothetical protein F4812DRAFT_8042 [Daldinia caldariorum]
MSYTSGISSSTSLMGFSVHQPAIGAPLQFFPAMGSKELDEMIDAYVPGNASILEKRATVSMEFFEHSMATGELFKFFMVYPSFGSATESPSTTFADSGYASNFTSPVMSESQWTQASNISSSSERRTQKPSPKKAALSNDFSHLPGMKILTKDGKDVTNSASRGCKTKEQRDHAHLMRIIKACDSCRRKKVRCDPSHKRSSGSSTTRTAKKAKKAAAPSVPAAAPPPQTTLQPLDQPLCMPSFDIADLSASSFDTIVSDSLVDPTMDWDQFVQYDEEPIPYDYDFLFDPEGHLTPTSSSSHSPSQPITPAQIAAPENTTVSITEDAQAVLPPYLNPGGEVGNNYADFNLYSPGSSICLDDDPSLTTEVAALPQSDYIRYVNDQSPADSHIRKSILDQDQSRDTQLGISTNIDYPASLVLQEQASSPTGLDTISYYEGISDAPIQSLVAQGDSRQRSQVPESRVPPGLPAPFSPVRTGESQLQPRTSPSPAGVGVSLSPLHESEPRSPRPTALRKHNQNLAERHKQQDTVATLTSSSGAWFTTSGGSEATMELSSTSQLRREFSKLPKTNIITHSAEGSKPSTLSEHRTMDAIASSSLSQDVASSKSSIAEPHAWNAPRRPSSGISHAISRIIAAQDAVEEIGFSDAAGLSTSSSDRTKTVPSLGCSRNNRPVERRLLQSASLRAPQSQARAGMHNQPKTIVSAIAAYVLLFAYASLSMLRHWQPLSDKAVDIGICLGSLSIVVAYTMLRQQISSAAMLDLATQLLSFPGRLVDGTNAAEPGFSRLSEDISKARSNFTNILDSSCKSTTALGSRIRRMTSLV